MPLIHNRELQTDQWQHLPSEIADQPDQRVIIDFARCLNEADYWQKRAGPFGIRVANDLDPDLLASWLPKVGIICIEFPKYTDGRGYSLARIIRRLGYSEDLRATGDILRDQLAFLERCGFDSFELKQGKDGVEALTAFGELGQPYQASHDRASPEWRRFG